MNTYADQLFVQAEIDRRLELFGVADALHRTPPVSRRPGILARLAGRARRVLRANRATVVTVGSTGHP